MNVIKLCRHVFFVCEQNVCSTDHTPSCCNEGQGVREACMIVVKLMGEFRYNASIMETICFHCGFITDSLYVL